MKTLKDYIAFLRENHLSQEANFYSIEVVGLLQKYGIPSPLDMSTQEVMATLYSLKDSLENQQPKWDGELTW